jgi:hypothetical protein
MSAQTWHEVLVVLPPIAQIGESEELEIGQHAGKVSVGKDERERRPEGITEL